MVTGVDGLIQNMYIVNLYLTTRQVRQLMSVVHKKTRVSCEIIFGINLLLLNFSYENEFLFTFKSNLIIPYQRFHIRPCCEAMYLTVHVTTCTY